MKKIIAFLISISMLCTLAACGGQTSENNSQASLPTNESAASDNVQESAKQPSETPAETALEDAAAEPETEGTDKKALVVYYSASGNTKAVAEYIAGAANADLFELVPVEPYSDADLDWTDDNSRVVYEHENPEARDTALVEETVSDWASYDTVFIGFPIWWGIAAWPVDNFIKANDFTGKTVVPFCTSASSGLGESGKLLAEAAGTGNWLEGQRFSSSSSEDDVRAWVDNLSL